MAANTLQDFLTKTIAELTAITELVTPADSTYLQQKVMSPLKDIIMSMLKPGYKYLGKENVQTLVYKNLADLLSNSPAGDAVGVNHDLSVEVVYQPLDADCTITANRPYTAIMSPDRNNFYIILADNINKNYYKDIKLVVNDGVVLSNCILDNCLVSSDGDISLETCDVVSTKFNVNQITIGDSTTIASSELKAQTEIIFDINYFTSKMYNSVFNKYPTNPLNNLTQEFNVYIETL